MQGETRKEHLSRLDTFRRKLADMPRPDAKQWGAISWQTSGPGFRCRHRTSNLQWARSAWTCRKSRGEECSLSGSSPWPQCAASSAGWRGLEVEGWSIEELREALGIMSECIRAADAEGCARGSAGSPMRTEGCRHGPRIATRGRRKPCGGYGRGLRLRAERNGMVNRPVRNGG